VVGFLFLWGGFGSGGFLWVGVFFWVVVFFALASFFLFSSMCYRITSPVDKGDAPTLFFVRLFFFTEASSTAEGGVFIRRWGLWRAKKHPTF